MDPQSPYNPEYGRLYQEWGPPSGTGMPPYLQPPRKVVSRRKMGFVGHGFHIMMCFFTCGLWIPVYMSRLRSRKTVTRAY